MKLKQLIQELQTILDESGDLEILIDDDLAIDSVFALPDDEPERVIIRSSNPL
jgi:hypothetical protein